MENDEAETQAFGDILPLEVVGELSGRTIQTFKTLGQETIQAVYGQETTTSFDLDSVIYAA